MDQTNRAIIVSEALLFIFVVLVIVMLAWGAPAASIDRVYDLADYMADHNTDQAKLIITFGGFILALGALIVIIYELTPPEAGSLKVEVGSGDARISTEEISARVEEEVRLMPQIQDVQAVVTGRGSRAEVRLSLHVRPEAELASTAEEACRRSRELITGQMGISLASEPKAELHYRELSVARPPAAASASAAVSSSVHDAPVWKATAGASARAAEQTTHEAEAAHESPPPTV